MAGQRRLGETILGAMKQAGITTNNVAVGMPASKTFTSIVRVENLPETELLNSIKYQLINIFRCRWMRRRWIMYRLGCVRMMRRKRRF